MWFVAPRLRAASIGSGGVTVIHLLSADAGDRLQPLVVRSAVLIMMVTLLLQMAAILHFAGAMLADVGLSTTTVLLLSLTVLTATVFAGGLRAASVIDTVQSVVLIAVALFLPLPALIATGGLTELRMAFMTIGPEATDWFGGKNGVAAIAFAAGVVGLGLAMCGQPHALARFMAAKDETTLRIARWVAPVWIAILLAAVVFCGWCARVLYSGPSHWLPCSSAGLAAR
jgi:sodium/proline symporter